LLLAIFISFLAFLVNVTDGFKIVPKFENSTSITLAFLASISFAIYSILSKKLSSKSASNDIFYTFVFAYLYSAISLIVVKKVPIIPKEATIYMLINGLFINGISYLFWVWALKDIKASIASTFVLASPIIASFWVYLLIGESLKFSFFVSIILIIIASILILKKDR
jgi:drug/metabolite transporter (DMT)-like permease